MDFERISEAVEVISSLGDPDVFISMPSPEGGLMEVRTAEDLLDYLRDSNAFFARSLGISRPLFEAHDDCIARNWHCLGSTSSGGDCRNYAMYFGDLRMLQHHGFPALLCARHKRQAAMIARAYHAAVEANS